MKSIVMREHTLPWVYQQWDLLAEQSASMRDAGVPASMFVAHRFGMLANITSTRTVPPPVGVCIDERDSILFKMEDARVHSNVFNPQTFVEWVVGFEASVRPLIAVRYTLNFFTGKGLHAWSSLHCRHVLLLILFVL